MNQDLTGNIFLPGIEISYASYTDVGDRKVNEDSIDLAGKGDIFGAFLCDGLGGHGMGDAASQHVVSVLSQLFFEGEYDAKSFIGPAFDYAQKSLMEAQKALRAEQKMKTTATALLIRDKTAYIGHVGDSRVYWFRKGKYKKRTLDHSVPQMMVISREIKDEEIRNHPERSMLLRVMGIPWDIPKYELMKPIKVKAGDAFLLCSDGFWELITEKQMEACYKEASGVQDWLYRMRVIVEETGRGKNMDNNSCIALEISKNK